MLQPLFHENSVINQTVQVLVLKSFSEYKYDHVSWSSLQHKYLSWGRTFTIT